MTREEAHRILSNGLVNAPSEHEWCMAFEMAIKALESKPKTKTGHWVTKIKSDLRGDMWPTNPKCSECGGEPYYSNTIYDYKFCPYCGARMVEPQESEEV